MILSLPRLPQRRSLPRLPLRRSAPRLPRRRSAPLRPLRRSSPARPSRRLYLSVPTSVSSPPVPVRTFARAWWPAKSAPTITTITVSKMCSRFIRLPPLVYSELVLFVFSRPCKETLVQGLYPTMLGGSLCHRRNDRSFGTKRVGVSLDKLP